MTAELTYVRVGSFSGSGTSLRKALAEKVSVIDYDLLALAREPRLLPARLKAFVEARRAGGVPWLKTRAWSVATQRALESDGLHGRPIVFAQSLPAFVMDPTITYVVYTDRVAREAMPGTPFALGFSPGWLEREEAFLRGAHRIYLMGPSTGAVLEQQYGIPANKIVVVGAGPNMSLGQPVASASCRTLLFVGIEWERKGGPDLLRAFAQLHAEFPHLELLVVGCRPPGPLPKGVHVLGRVPHAQMETLYSRADALVLPSHLDAVPIALIEALIKGIPCIGTTAGNNMGWLIGDAGEIITPGRVDALADALRRIVANYGSYRERALARGAYMREHFRWGTIASRILEDIT